MSQQQSKGVGGNLREKKTKTKKKQLSSEEVELLI